MLGLTPVITPIPARRPILQKVLSTHHNYNILKRNNLPCTYLFKHCIGIIRKITNYARYHPECRRDCVNQPKASLTQHATSGSKRHRYIHDLEGSTSRTSNRARRVGCEYWRLSLRRTALTSVVKVCRDRLRTWYVSSSKHEETKICSDATKAISTIITCMIWWLPSPVQACPLSFGCQAQIMYRSSVL